MNAVEVAEGSVFTYRLPNGAHVLIHQSSVIQSKGTSEVDCEETVPLLFLEDGQISYNGHEILQTQLLDHTTETTSFLLPASPLEIANDKTDQATIETESTEAVVSDSPQAIDETEKKQQNVEGEKVLEGENVTLDKLEDFVELVTSYRCRICPFATPDQQQLIQHLHLQHMRMKLDNSTNSTTPQETLTAVSSEPLEFANDVLAENPQPVCEKLIYLCGQCNEGFGSLESCKQHMMQDHDMIVLDAAADSKSREPGDKSGVDAEGLFSIQADKLNGETDKQEIIIQTKSVGDKQHSAVAAPATGKRKVRMPRMLEREYLLAKVTGNAGTPHPNDNKLKCVERSCQYKFSSEEALHIHMSCHTAATATNASDAKSDGTTTTTATTTAAAAAAAAVAASTTTTTTSTSTNTRREFACCVCGERFERWRGCALHLWKTHEVDAGLLSCPVCHTYKTVTAVKLENHVKIHGEARAYTCPDCGKGFKQASQLRNHRVMHLDRKVGPVPRWYASKRCDICFKSYADSKCLKKHIQAVHSKLRPYVCQVCGHASARKAMLQMHLRQHTGEKPYGCSLCDYRTGDHNSLRRHTMRHTGQRPYRCPHCEYSAIQSNSYKNHLRSKHPGMQGLFNCTQCQFRTVSQEGFLQHVSDHKNGLISSSQPEGEIEVFPGNVAAAHLIYRCLNAALSTDGSPLQANVTGSATSEDGTTQTITIQIPTQQDGTEVEVEDEETTPCFLAIQEEEEEDVDTGGITIPAEPDPDPSSSPGIIPGGS